MRDGKLLVCNTPNAIKIQTNEETIEKAFIKIVKEAEK